MFKQKYIIPVESETPSPIFIANTIYGAIFIALATLISLPYFAKALFRSG